MAADARRRNVLVAPLLLLVLIALLLLRCRKPEPAPAERVDVPARPVAEAQPEPRPGEAPPPAAQTAEVLTPATLEAPDEVGAGAEFPVAWTGPANEGDYVTIARADAPSEAALHYRETREGATLALTAWWRPIQPAKAKSKARRGWATGASL